MQRNDSRRGRLQPYPYSAPPPFPGPTVTWAGVATSVGCAMAGAAGRKRRAIDHAADEAAAAPRARASRSAAATDAPTGSRAARRAAEAAARAIVTSAAVVRVAAVGAAAGQAAAGSATTAPTGRHAAMTATQAAAAAIPPFNIENYDISPVRRDGEPAVNPPAAAADAASTASGVVADAADADAVTAATPTADGAAIGSPVSGGGSPAAVGGTWRSSLFAVLPTMAWAEGFWQMVSPFARAVVREELAAAAINPDVVAETAKQVVDRVLPAMDAHIKAITAPVQVPWPQRPVEDIRAAAARVFPNKVVKKTMAHFAAIRILVLTAQAAADGDVLTPFFPPACKKDVGDQFALAHFRVLCLSVLQSLHAAIKATGRVPDMLRGKGVVRSSQLDAVDEAFLSILRAIFDDGRAAARACFYRFIAYYLMNVSPKVYIRMVNPTAAVLDAAEAEGSDYFAVETCHVASANGVVSSFSPPPFPAPAPSGPSGGVFTTVRSAVSGPAETGGSSTFERAIGTDSSYTTIAGLYYPHVGGEHLAKRTLCLFTLTRVFLQVLCMCNYQFPDKVLMAGAKSLRKIITGAPIAWTSADGMDFDHTMVLGPCKWWLLLPRLTTRNNLDKKLQTLTAEEQRTLVANNGLGVAVAPLGDVEEAGDD